MIIYKFLLLTICVEKIFSYVKQGDRIIEYDDFEEFKNYINKSYMHAYDELRSRAAFEENRAAVRHHNALFDEGKSSYRLGTNIMADMDIARLNSQKSLRDKHKIFRAPNFMATAIATPLLTQIINCDEKNNDSYLKAFLRLLLSKRIETEDNASEIVGSPLLHKTPESIDWRQKGFVTSPDNQKTCGSCYAFSVAESIEGQVFKRTGRILNLSPQQIVDCSTSHGNQGCTGGSLRNTLKYLQDTGGLMRAKDYKYVTKKGKCQFVPELAVVNVTSWAILPGKDEKAIEAAVAHIGPVAVSINASPKTFQLYSDGVYDDSSCPSNSVNHAMLVVGYTKDYWILKNWWGEYWGEGGYMRIAKGKNICGIANYAAYAVV